MSQDTTTSPAAPTAKSAWKCPVCGASEPVQAATKEVQCIGCARVIFTRGRAAARKARSRANAANRTAEQIRNTQAKRNKRGSLTMCGATPLKEKYVTPEGCTVFVLGTTPLAAVARQEKKSLLSPGRHSTLTAAGENGTLVDLMAWLEDQNDANLAAERSYKAFVS